MRAAKSIYRLCRRHNDHTQAAAAAAAEEGGGKFLPERQPGLTFQICWPILNASLML